MPLTNQQLYFNGAPSTIGRYRPTPLPARRLSNIQLYYNGVNPQSRVVLSSAAPRQRAAPAPSPAPRSLGIGGSAPAPSGGAGSAGVAQILAAMGNPLAAGVLSNAQRVDLKRRAASDVGLELNPEIQARQFAFNEAARSAGGQINQLRKQLGLTTTETKQLYGNLDVLLQGIAQKQAANLNTARGQSDAAFAALANQVNSRYSGAQADVAKELGRLGQATTPASQRLTADAANAAAQVGAGKARADSTIAAIQAAGASEQGQLRSSAAATAPMLIAQATNQERQQEGSILQERDSARRQLQFEIKQLSGSRRAKVQKLYEQYLAEAQQAAQDAAQTNFLNTIKAAELGISQGQLDVARQRAADSAQASHDNLVLRAKELQAKLAAGTKVPLTGMEKAYTYLAGYKGRVPQAQLQQVLEDAINGNSNDPGFKAGSPGPGQIPGYSKQYLDVYLNDISKAARARGWTATEAQALRNAALKYLS